MAKKSEEKQTETKSVEKKYQVIQDFRDLQDGGKVYFKGDRYPNPVNKKIDEERIDELLSKDNKRGAAVIKEIE